MQKKRLAALLRALAARLDPPVAKVAAGCQFTGSGTGTTIHLYGADPTSTAGVIRWDAIPNGPSTS